MKRIVLPVAILAAGPAWAEDGGSEPLKALGGFAVVVLALLSVAYLRSIASRIARAIRQGPRALVGRQKLIVDMFKSGVLYRDGVFESVLAPGSHWIRPKGAHLVNVDMRPQVLRFNEVATTADHLRVELRVVARVQIRDARAAFESATNYREEFVAQIQSAIKKLAQERTLKDLHLRQAEFNLAGQILAGSLIQPAGAECIGFELLHTESAGEPPGKDDREIGFRAR